MQDESGIDGSQLEKIFEPAESVESPQEQTVEQPSQQATAEPPQRDVSQIPEQFRDYTPEQWFDEWNKKNSQLGRYKQAFEDMRQQSQFQAPPVNRTGFDINRYQQVQSSLPGTEAKGQEQTQQQIDWNEKYYENPFHATEEAAMRGARKVLQEWEQGQVAKTQQNMMARRQAMDSIVTAEIQNLRLDNVETFDDGLLDIMQRIDRTDPEFAALEHDPALTEEKLRQGVKSLYNKALAEKERIATEYLKQKGYDEESIKAYKAAQKQAAANGTPRGKAASVNSAQSEAEQFPDWFKERYGFLVQD